MAERKRKPAGKKSQPAKGKIVGGVYRGRTKYIDPEPKLERNYVAVRANGNKVSVVKMKSYKKDVDPDLVEISQKKYGLEKRTGVDHEIFRKNRMSKEPLDVSNKRVFPNGTPEFHLTSRDTHRVLVHINQHNKKKPKP